MSSNAVCVRADLSGKIAKGYEKHLNKLFDGELFTFNDMVVDINRWVEKKTKGMITDIADDSMRDMLASLINAIAFEAKWAKEYEEDDIYPDLFHNVDGTDTEVEMMNSKENMYVEDKHFTGVVKPYKKAGYSFMALLPKDEKPGAIKKLIDYADFKKLYEKRTYETVYTEIPEFQYDFGDEISDLCKQMGINLAFSNRADFSPMIAEWVKIERIIHKAFIQVDRKGTKAAAVTMAVAVAGCIPSFDY